MLTAEQFAEQKFDLPEGGRWHELVAGEIVVLDPPDTAHGNVVLNLSKALANYLQHSQEGYACFELGLIVARGPDTVRCPPVCCFTEGERFAEIDQIVTENRPALVVEIASTPDRRQDMETRVEQYLAWEVPLVWVVDPPARAVYRFQPGLPAATLGEQDTLSGGPVLTGFRVAVEALFAEPAWWRTG